MEGSECEEECWKWEELTLEATLKHPPAQLVSQERFDELTRGIDRRLLELKLEEDVPVYAGSLGKDRGNRDWERRDSSCLTPWFLVIKDGDTSSIQLGSAASLASSPTRSLCSNRDSGDAVASCTLRLKCHNPDARDHEKYSYATGAQVSPHHVVTAKHFTWSNATRDRYTAITATPSTNEAFSDNRVRRAHLVKLGGSHARVQAEPMRDPITGCEMEDNEVAGFAFMKIENTGKGPFIHTFGKESSSMLLPVSVTYLGKRAEGVACGILSFPMVDEFWASNEHIPEPRHGGGMYEIMPGLLHKPFQNSSDAVLLEQYKISIRDQSDGNAANVLAMIKEMLRNSTGRYHTGSMICSMGRVRGFNSNVIAADYSCLQGSSGAVVFSPALPAGTYIGVHFRPAPPVVSAHGNWYCPEHNLATSTDNPVFVEAFVKNIFGSLPPPAAFGADQARLAAFFHYLVKHLKLIVSVVEDWNEGQLRWLHWVVEEMHIQRGSSGSGFGQDEPGAKQAFVRRMMELSEQLLALAATCDDVAGITMPRTPGELEVLLRSRMLGDMFCIVIGDEMVGRGVDISPWGLPCTVRHMSVLASLAQILA